MSFFFANLGWLGLLGLGLLPLIIHLVARRRPKKREFPSLYFLQEIVKKTSRYQKPKDLLLLILRTLAILALVAAFLHPLLTNWGEGRSEQGQSSVIFVVDVSASMAANEGAGRRFDLAREKTLDLLRELRPERANIIWINAQPEAVFPEPGPNLSFLNESLGLAEPLAESGSIREALRLAADQLALLEGEKELFIISDFQANAWKDIELPAGVEVTTVRCATQTPANVAVVDVRTSPLQPVVGEELEILARVRNFSQEAVAAPLILEIGGLRESFELNLEAGAESQVSYALPLAREGELVVQAQLGDLGMESFLQDNVRRSLVKVRPARRLGVVGQELPAPIEGLGRALPWLEVESLAIDQLSAQWAQEYEYLWLWNWQGEGLEQLRSLHAQGLALLVSPAANCSADDLAALFALSENQPRLELQEAVEPWSLRFERLEHPLFDLYRSGEFGEPLQAEISGRVKLPQAWAQETAALISFSDGVPALLWKRDGQQAPRILWTLPLDTEKSSLGAMASWVPFMGELLRLSASLDSGAGESLPGYALGWVRPESVPLESVDLRRVGQEGKLEIGTADSALQLVSEELAAPGVYSWQVNGQKVATSVVNFPAQESLLEPLEQESFAQGSEVLNAAAVDRFTALREGYPLWPWLLGFALLCLLCESWLGAWSGKARPESEATQLA